MSVTPLFRADDPVHRSVDELLPWYLNGTLDTGEHAKIDAHVAQCLRCRRELDTQRALRTLLAREDPEIAVGQALVRLHTRIDQLESGWRGGAGRAFLRRFWRESPSWLRFAFVGQLALVCAFALALVSARNTPHFYRTLGTPTESAIRFTVSVENAAGEAELRAVLEETGAYIVTGGNGRYTVAVTAERSEDTLRRLRAGRGVGAVERIPAEAAGSR